MGGASELEIGAQLGHAPGSRITQRYIHFAQEHVREKAGIMGEVIAKAVADYSAEQQPIVAERRRDGKIVQHVRDMEVAPETWAPPAVSPEKQP